MTAPYRCLFCGAPTWLHPREQSVGIEGCTPVDHGEPEVEELDGDEAADAWAAATGAGGLDDLSPR